MNQNQWTIVSAIILLGALFFGLMRRRYKTNGTKNIRKVIKNKLGFSVIDNGSSVNVQWDDIKEIKTYKRDLLTIDQIVLQFTQANGACVAIAEDCEGFQELASWMQEQYQTIPKDWLEKVMFPPMGTNETVLFSAVA